MSEYDQAIDVLLTLASNKPDSRDAHFELGVALLAQGRSDAAVHELQKALEIDPEFVDAHYVLAQAFVQIGQFDEGLARFNSVLEIDPRPAGAYQWRARIFTQSGQIAAAIADFRKALECAPRVSRSASQLGCNTRKTRRCRRGSESSLSRRRPQPEKRAVSIRIRGLSDADSALP